MHGLPQSTSLFTPSCCSIECATTTYSKASFTWGLHNCTPMKGHVYLHRCSVLHPAGSPIAVNWDTMAAWAQPRPQCDIDADAGAWPQMHPALVQFGAIRSQCWDFPGFSSQIFTWCIYDVKKCIDFLHFCNKYHSLIHPLFIFTLKRSTYSRIFQVSRSCHNVIYKHTSLINLDLFAN